MVCFVPDDVTNSASISLHAGTSNTDEDPQISPPLTFNATYNALEAICPVSARNRPFECFPVNPIGALLGVEDARGEQETERSIWSASKFLLMNGSEKCDGAPLHSTYIEERFKANTDSGPAVGLHERTLT
jgi:hypothetical protein